MPFQSRWVLEGVIGDILAANIHTRRMHLSTVKGTWRILDNFNISLFSIGEKILIKVVVVSYFSI